MIDSERTARDAWDQGCWTPRSKKIRGVYGYDRNNNFGRLTEMWKLRA
jgi:hypothetical protein